MPKERTEEEILSKAPLRVKLGEDEYELPILPILKMSAWRKKLVEVANEIGGLGVSLSALGTAFFAFPHKMVDLVLAYDPKLPRKKIMKTATEEQIATAFSSIIPVAFPFLRQLSLMKSVLMASQSISEKSTNSSSSSTDSRQIM